MNNYLTTTFKNVRFIKTLILFSLLIMAGQKSFGQTTFSWRNDQNPTSGQWNVSSYWWNGSAAALPGGGEILFLDGTIGTSMTNDLPSTNRHKIIFGSTNSPASRIISGSTQNQFFEFSTTWPLIQNDASVLHTINFPVKAANTAGINLELAAIGGLLAFGGAMDNNGKVIQIYGNNSATDAANRNVVFNC